MAKVAGDALVTRLKRRMGWNSADATATTDALNALNEAQKRICGRRSFSFLTVRTTINLVTAAGDVVAPTAPAIDFGKAVTMERPDGLPLVYLPPDDFSLNSIYTYRASEVTRPSFFTIANTAAEPPVPTIYFKPANTTGSTITYAISYQRVIADLTNAGTSFSALPEGYELALLLTEAEILEKRVMNKPVAGDVIERHMADLEAFYNAFRASKEEAKTDDETAQRKIYKTQTREGA